MEEENLSKKIDKNYIADLTMALIRDGVDINMEDSEKIFKYLIKYDVKDYEPSQLAKMLVADGVLKKGKPIKRPSLLKNVIIPLSILFGVYSTITPLDTRTERNPYQDFVARNVVYGEDSLKANMEIDGKVIGVFDGSYINWPHLEDLREGDRVTRRKVKALPLVTLVSEYLGLGKPIEWPRIDILRINEREKLEK